jgi:hypothetical protein
MGLSYGFFHAFLLPGLVIGFSGNSIDRVEILTQKIVEGFAVRLRLDFW